MRRGDVATRKMSQTNTDYPHKNFHRAVDCASEPGLCDVDELLELADKLEEYDGCFFEDDSDKAACMKEKDDRLDVADLLRLEAELLLREDYLENANLFKADVDKARLQEWDEHCQELDMYSNY